MVENTRVVLSTLVNDCNVLIELGQCIKTDEQRGVTGSPQLGTVSNSCLISWFRCPKPSEKAFTTKRARELDMVIWKLVAAQRNTGRLEKIEVWSAAGIMVDPCKAVDCWKIKRPVVKPKSKSYVQQRQENQILFIN